MVQSQAPSRHPAEQDKQLTLEYKNQKYIHNGQKQDFRPIMKYLEQVR